MAMTRVASLPLQDSMATAISRVTGKLADSQRQLATGKTADRHAGLGAGAVRVLTARNLLERTQGHIGAARQLTHTLNIYDSHMSQLETSMMSLRESLATGLGVQVGTGLDADIGNGFIELANTLNARDGGVALFSGSRTDGPAFTPATPADTLSVTDQDAFQTDGVRQTTRVADGANIEHGVDGRVIGTEFLSAFRTLAQAGPFGETLTANQMDAIKDAMKLLDGGLETLRVANAENGRSLARADQLSQRAERRVTMLTEVISRIEDVNLAELATNLAAQKTMLEASYAVFTRLSGLSLASYLR
jgi:flagellar hook-associated protein 3 FlgL